MWLSVFSWVDNWIQKSSVALTRLMFLLLSQIVYTFPSLQLIITCNPNTSQPSATRIHFKINKPCIKTAHATKLAEILPRSAIRHQPLALGVPDLGADVRLGVLTKLAVIALRNVQWDHMVAWNPIRNSKVNWKPTWKQADTTLSTLIYSDPTRLWVVRVMEGNNWGVLKSVQ